MAQLNVKGGFRVGFWGDPVAQMKLRVFSARSQVMLSSYVSKKAHDMELYMKTNHPWRNRTGMAERNLSAKVTKSKFGWSQQIELSQGVPYGVYLEYRWGGRYAIVQPTYRKLQQEVRTELPSIFKMRGKL